MKIHMTDLPQGSEDGEGSESKAFGKQNSQDRGGLNAKQKRRQGPSVSLVLAEEVGDGTIQSDKEHRRHDAELGAL